MHTSKLIEIQPAFESLLRNIDEGRVSHAQLFSHREGGLAISYALAYVQYLLCENKQGLSSCGECKHCKAMKNMTHPDVQFVFPVAKQESKSLGISEEYLPLFRTKLSENPYMSSNSWNLQTDFNGKSTQIPVRQFDEINKFLSLKSFYDSYKVVLIWSPELMNIATANKLLKHIEEPQPKTLFLFVSEHAHEILPTIISRTQRTHFIQAQKSNIQKYLAQINTSLSSEELASISATCEGNIDLAIKKLENNEMMSEIITLFTQWAKICYGGSQGINLLELNNLTDSLDKKGKEFQKNFLKFCLQIFNSIAKLQAGIEDSSKIIDSPDFDLTRYSKLFDFNSLSVIMEQTEKSLFHIERNVNTKFTLNNYGLKFHYLSRYKNIPELYL